MNKPPLDPPCVDEAPIEGSLTPYDEEHLITYLRLLDAAHDNADWREVAQLVLHIDPDEHPVRARKCFESHMARAQWMTQQGYRHLLKCD
jgi:hypothetical protein